MGNCSALNRRHKECVSEQIDCLLLPVLKKPTYVNVTRAK